MAVVLLLAVAYWGNAGRRGPGDMDVAALPGADSPFQAGILADGHVTYEEYERAVHAAMDCLEEAGVTVEGPHSVERRGITFLNYSYGAVEREADLAQFEETFDTCHMTYESAVKEAYAYQHRPTPAQVQRHHELVVACLVRHGAEVPGGIGPAELPQVLQDSDHAPRCLDEADERMNAEAARNG